MKRKLIRILSCIMAVAAVSIYSNAMIAAAEDSQIETVQAASINNLNSSLDIEKDANEIENSEANIKNESESVSDSEDASVSENNENTLKDNDDSYYIEQAPEEDSVNGQEEEKESDMDDSNEEDAEEEDKEKDKKLYSIKAAKAKPLIYGYNEGDSDVEITITNKIFGELSYEIEMPEIFKIKSSLTGTVYDKDSETILLTLPKGKDANVYKENIKIKTTSITTDGMCFVNNESIPVEQEVICPSIYGKQTDKFHVSEGYANTVIPISINNKGFALLSLINLQPEKGSRSPFESGWDMIYLKPNGKDETYVRLKPNLSPGVYEDNIIIMANGIKKIAVVPVTVTVDPVENITVDPAETVTINIHLTKK